MNKMKYFFLAKVFIWDFEQECSLQGGMDKIAPDSESDWSSPEFLL